MHSGNMMQIAVEKARLSSIFPRWIRSGTKIIPPPAPNNPLMIPDAIPDNPYIIQFLLDKKHPLRWYFFIEGDILFGLQNLLYNISRNH